VKALAHRTGRVLLFVATCAAAFLLIEGFSSTILVGRKLLTAARSPLAERVNTQYDEELGWVAIPTLYVPDMYGPGVYLRTNSRGFRDNEEIEAVAPAGRLRLICSGDSFTLGWGVDNDNAWCQRLSSTDRRFQTVNMGQGGYGVDQAYLWYRRDGIALEHHVHLFAFITDDFSRMQWDNYAGYGKPVLRFKDGHLVTENVPVPRRGYYFPWLTQNGRLLWALRSVELTGAIAGKILSRGAGGAERKVPLSEARQTAAAVFEALNELNRTRKSTLVLVHLPARGDYDGDDLTDSWRRFVGIESAALGVPFIDLVEEIQRMSRDEVESMFTAPEELEFRGALRHYTPRGNEEIASMIHSRLTALPELSAKLSGLH